ITPRIHVVARHRQRTELAAGAPRAQGRPTGPVPPGNISDRAAPCPRELAPRIQVTAGYRQRGHLRRSAPEEGGIAAYPQTQGRPTVPVPFGDVSGRNAACNREIPPHIDV